MKKAIWLHAVSLGEMKAACPLYRALKSRYADHRFIVTTVTKTGRAEAEKAFSDADEIHFLPLDFPWVVKRWVQRIKPSLFIAVETDLWPSLLKAIQTSGGKTVLISGKLSDNSAKWFSRFSFFAKKLFSRLDLIGVQNEEHFHKFLPFVKNRERLVITGNLKLDLQKERVEIPSELSFLKNERVLTLASTHPSEEEALLEALKGFDAYIFLAPRHPERFLEVKALLEKKKIPHVSLSKMEKKERLILVDRMGVLPLCYTLSSLAIVGGSFVKGIGGHNIVEPCLYGTPVFFGPWMEKQREFEQKVTKSQAGKSYSLSELRDGVNHFFENQKSFREGTERLFEKGESPTEKALQKIVNLYENNRL